jgi:hypothetical protein
MKGSVFAKTLPKKAGPRREQMLLDAVRRRDIAPIAWVPITTKIKTAGGNQYTATFKVSKDALRAGDANDSFRFSVNHRTAQHIADELECVLPTPYLSDQIWKQATVKLPSLSQTRSWHADGTMADTDRMLEQSERVDKLIAQHVAKVGKSGLIADVGKDWVTHPELWQPYSPSPRCEKGHPRAMNYGWHWDVPPGHKGQEFYASTMPGVRVIQPAARCHTIPHVDYSQVVRLIRRDVEVCGLGYSGGCGKIDIRQIATSPSIHGLVSAAGPLQAMRHPDVSPSCDKRCPEPVQPAGMNGPSTPPAPPSPPAEPPPEVGPLTCPTGCDELPETEPDPTREYLQAELSISDKLVMVAGGGVLGFFAVKWLLPRL